MATSTENRKRLIIDTDAGTDDAQAILMALAHPNLAEVIALTTCQGNTSVTNCSLNVLRVLKVAGRLDIPVYKGSTKALTGGQLSSPDYHGSDGFGDVPDPEAPGLEMLQSEHAVYALVRMVNESPGEYSLICLAPLTNIALALRLDPEFGKKLRECFIMGGNYEAKGNITTNTEFNFHADPEAAHVTLNELDLPITIICWELCINNTFSWDWYKHFAKIDTPKGRFIQKILAWTIATYYSEVNRQQQFTMADQFCIAAAIAPNIVTESRDAKASIELGGSLTRGQMIADFQCSSEKKPNVKIVMNVRQDLLSDMMHAAVDHKQHS